MKFTKALLTGASSGIGEALAFLLASKNIPLILVGRKRERLERIAEKIEVQTTVLALDLVKERAKVLQIIGEQAPDLIINSAGSGLYGEVLSYDTALQLELLQINAVAALEITAESARRLISEGKRGVIVNISSCTAFQPFPHAAVYSAAKAFIKQFSESMDIETMPRGVRILTSCPGVVETNFQDRAAGCRGQKRIHAMSAKFAAQQIWQQIEQRQAIKIFDLRYRLCYFFSKFFPKRFLLWGLNRFFSTQIPPRDFVPSKERIDADI